MKISTIEEIFFNDDHIISKMKNTEKYEELSDKSYDAYEKLKAKLNDEQKELLEKFISFHIGMECETEVTFFVTGLKYGMRLAFECLSD